MRNFKEFIENQQVSRLIESLEPIVYDSEFNPIEFFEELFDVAFASARTISERCDVLILKENVLDLLLEVDPAAAAPAAPATTAAPAAGWRANGVLGTAKNFLFGNKQQPQQQQPQRQLGGTTLKGDTLEILHHLLMDPARVKGDAQHPPMPKPVYDSILGWLKSASQYAQHPENQAAQTAAPTPPPAAQTAAPSAQSTGSSYGGIPVPQTAAPTPTP